MLIIKRLGSFSWISNYSIYLKHRTVKNKDLYQYFPFFEHLLLDNSHNFSHLSYHIIAGECNGEHRSGFDEIEDFSDKEAIVSESSPSTKLERRRKIEDLFEEKRLREELDEFG